MRPSACNGQLRACAHNSIELYLSRDDDEFSFVACILKLAKELAGGLAGGRTTGAAADADNRA